jgi:hypothetical protein
MRIELEAPSTIAAGAECQLRAILINDGYEPVVVMRNAFIGPNLRPASPSGQPSPDSVEATFGQPDEPFTLQPFTFYGRERTWTGLPPGEMVVSASYRSADGGVDLSETSRLRVE